jgi:hypothetical protein
VYRTIGTTGMPRRSIPEIGIRTADSSDFFDISPKSVMTCIIDTGGKFYLIGKVYHRLRASTTVPWYSTDNGGAIAETFLRTLFASIVGLEWTKIKNKPLQNAVR